MNFGQIRRRSVFFVLSRLSRWGNKYVLQPCDFHAMKTAQVISPFFQCLSLFSIGYSILMTRHMISLNQSVPHIHEVYILIYKTSQTYCLKWWSRQNIDVIDVFRSYQLYNWMYPKFSETEFKKISVFHILVRANIYVLLLFTMPLS